MLLLHISYQAISKWENGLAQPDISTLPAIANYFTVTIDELFGFKLDSLNNKERFLQFMVNNGMLKVHKGHDDSSNEAEISINTEKFETNSQIYKIGSFYADFMSVSEGTTKTGSQTIEEKYNTKVYSVITKEDINRAIKNDIIVSQ